MALVDLGSAGQHHPKGNINVNASCVEWRCVPLLTEEDRKAKKVSDGLFKDSSARG